MSTTVAPHAAVERGLPSARSRFLLPSLSDFFFVAVFVWLFIAEPGAWERLLRDSDTGIHIRTGYFVLDHGRVPAIDPYSFSRAGQPWFAFEWLTGVVWASLHREWGLGGVAVFAGIIIVLVLTILLRDMLRRGTNALLALGLSLAAGSALSVHYHARPHLITLLFLTISAYVIEQDRRRHSRWLWSLIPLTIVWTNMHGGFMILLVCLGILAAGRAAERGWSDARRYGLLGIGCALASVMNPYGLGLHAHIVQLMSSRWLRDAVDEFQSPKFRSEAMLIYMLLLFAGLGVAALLLQRKRIVEPLWILAFAYFSLTSVRHVPLYILLVTPIAGVELTRIWNDYAWRQPRKSAARILHDLGVLAPHNLGGTGLWAAAVVLAIVSFQPASAWPVDLNRRMFPAELVSKHGQLLTRSRVLTSDQWGGYLIFHHYPEQRVFIDGRHDLYGPQLIGDYLAAWQGGHNWRAVLDKYAFNVILAPKDQPIAALALTLPEWRVLDRDDKTVLLIHISSQVEPLPEP